MIYNILEIKMKTKDKVEITQRYIETEKGMLLLPIKTESVNDITHSNIISRRQIGQIDLELKGFTPKRTKQDFELNREGIKEFVTADEIYDDE